MTDTDTAKQYLYLVSVSMLYEEGYKNNKVRIKSKKKDCIHRLFSI